MADQKSSAQAGRFAFGIDTWAVIIALALALAVRADLFHKVPW